MPLADVARAEALLQRDDAASRAGGQEFSPTHL